MKIYSHIEPFDLEQNVYLIDDYNRIINSIGKFPLVTLNAVLVEYCKAHNVHEICFSGNEDYISKLIKEPIEEKANNYPLTINIIHEV